MISIAYWYLNHQSPSVLMIDDLSDAYIKVHKKDHMNDWGYLCNQKNSAYSFLEKELLNHYKKIKITFFVPYEKHAVINENTPYLYRKYAVGERGEFSNFLKTLIKKGHEISHHGSNHGAYINPLNFLTVKNFKHEWELFRNIEEGVKRTLLGVESFKKYTHIDITGGKFCGYKKRENSLEIIDKCNFLYWCDTINFINKNYDCKIFGKNKIISFPTNFSGNSFVRLIYKTNNPKRDNKKKILKYLQPIYNLLQYKQLNRLYKNKKIISIQEHISPSTTMGTIQSANIVSDISSLNKIYHFLAKKSIWYATCQEIATYFYIRENTTVKEENNQLTIYFNNHKKFSNTSISLFHNEPFTLTNGTIKYLSFNNNNSQVLNVPIEHGENIFHIQRGV